MDVHDSGPRSALERSHPRMATRGGAETPHATERQGEEVETDTTFVDDETRYVIRTSVLNVPGPLAQLVAELCEIQDVYSSLFWDDQRDPVDLARVTVIVRACTVAEHDASPTELIVPLTCCEGCG